MHPPLDVLYGLRLQGRSRLFIPATEPQKGFRRVSEGVLEGVSEGFLKGFRRVLKGVSWRTLQNPFKTPSRSLRKPFKKVSKSMMCWASRGFKISSRVRGSCSRKCEESLEAKTEKFSRSLSWIDILKREWTFHRPHCDKSPPKGPQHTKNCTRSEFTICSEFTTRSDSLLKMYWITTFCTELLYFQ